MNKTTVFITLTGFVAVWQLAQAGEISGTVTLKGTPPAEVKIDKSADAHCGAPGTTHHYVVGPKGELANVVVFLDGISGKSTGPSAPPVILDQKGCEYMPSIFAVQTGQKIMIKNSDPTLHNVHAQPAETSGNKEINEAQMPNGPEKTYVASKPEMFLKFKCDVHPWMFSWVSVFDHPYFAVTGSDGTYKIENVPPGKYKLQIAHRKAGTATQEIEVKEGAPTKADFTLEAK